MNTPFNSIAMTTAEAPKQQHAYVVPTKKITLPAHLAQYQKSKTYSEFIAFVLELNDAVKNKKIRDDCKVRLISFLTVVRRLVR